MKDRLLSGLLTAISRTLFLRDRLTGRMNHLLTDRSFTSERLFIASGDRSLSVVYVSAGKDSPAVLICHGIGERVEYWGKVQALLQQMGISTLAFNYSGYGESSGSISSSNCVKDAIVAFAELLSSGHRTNFLLGFSLGSGVVCAAAAHLDADGVILCESFSSLREAGCAIGFPAWMTRLIPDIWRNVDRVSDLKLPVLAVHSDGDRLFPVSMAKLIFAGCGVRGELTLVNGLSHNAPIFAPSKAYWQPVAEWVKRHHSEAAAATPRAAGS